MRCIISIEASHQRGMGHLFRGLHLAAELNEGGDEVVFVLNDDERSREIVQDAGFRFETVPAYERNNRWEGPILEHYDSAWWINDRLDTDLMHADTIVKSGTKLATFDDHGKGAEKAVYNFLAMDFYPERKAYNGLYGAEYMIVNPAIDSSRITDYQLHEPLDLLVTMGGSDTYGVTPRVLDALSGLGDAITVRVVIGPNFRHQRELSSALQRFNRPVTIHERVSDLIGLMASADLVVCGGGVTLFEAAAMGIPAVTIANEVHEIPVTQWFEEKGFGLSAGFHKDAFDNRLFHNLNELLIDEVRLKEMNRIGRRLVDAKGAARIVALLRDVHGK